MNISLQKIKHLLFLALLAAPILGQAQAGLLQEKTAFKNTPLKIWAQDLSGQGLQLRTNPEHGEIIDRIEGLQSIDTFLYLPNEDFLGLDEFVFEHFTTIPPSFPTLVHTTVKIKVLPSYVEAQHDYTVITTGEEARIRVITNDSVTHGALTVDPIFPVVNHGSVTVDEERGYVNFIPEAGYTGLADFNYVACDSVGTCAMGSVTVYVNEPSATFNDEIRLGTGQNTIKAIPMPFMVTSIGTPTKGRGKVSIEKSAYAVVYQPNLDESGDDEFIVYGENGNQRKVTLDIIERPVNSTSLAKDDVVYAILGEPVDINLVANDNYVGISKIDILHVQGGTISNQANSRAGEVTFTPNEGFRGVGRIWYQVFDAGYMEHIGFAYVVYDRNNFGPNVRDYEYTFKVNPGQTK